MKKQDIYLRPITIFITIVVVAFLSCASPNQVDEEGEEQTSEEGIPELGAEAGVDGETPSAETELSELGDLDAAADPTASASAETPSDSTVPPEESSASASSEMAPSDTAPTDTADGGGDLESLGVDDKAAEDALAANQEALPAESTTAEAPPVDIAPEASTGDPSLDIPMDSPPVTADATLPSDSGLPPAEDIPSSPAEALPKAPSDMSLGTGDGTESKPKFSGVSRMPKVPTGALKKGNASLNRFYFLREGDTPETVSQLVYGSADKAQDLAKWNKGWKPGKLVYYSSASQPDDSEMKSFYQERNITPDEYTVKKGDWLSRIAAKKLGSAHSWKEIAVVNGMSSADALEPGQKLAIYPSNLSAGAAPPEPPSSAPIAQAEPPPGEPSKPSSVNEASSPPPIDASGAPLPPEGEVLPPPEAASPPPPVSEPPVPEKFTKKPKKQTGVDFGKLVEQNMFAIVTGVGFILLLVALMAVNRRKNAKQAGEDFGEDGFAKRGRK